MSRSKSVFFILLLVVNFAVCACTSFFPKEGPKKVQLKNGEQIFSFYLSEKHPNAKEDLVYTSLYNQQLQYMLGAYQGTLLDGTFEVNDYWSGRLTVVGSYDDGLKEGEWKYYNEDGALEEIAAWKNGQLVEQENASEQKFEEQVTDRKADSTKRRSWRIGPFFRDLFTKDSIPNAQ